MIWDPEQYALGNYFQTQINEKFRSTFSVRPFGDILDVGCGDGQYTNFLAKIYKNSRILAIDNSAEMIAHAKDYWTSKNLSFEVQRIEKYHQSYMFDFVLSFWCLQWTKIEVAFANIFQALKIEGRFYATFSSFSESSILQIWYELAKRGLHSEVANDNIQRLLPYESYFYRVLNTVHRIPFRHVKMDLKTYRVALPNINYMKNLILILPAIKKIPEAQQGQLIADMLDAFEHICQHKYGGKLYYETRPIFIEAVK